VLVVDNVALYADCQQQYQQQLLSSDENTAGYSDSLQPLQNQAFAAQSQYYSSQGCHSQVVHGAVQACHAQQHHSPMRSQFQPPAPAPVSDEYSSSWQQSMSSAVNYTADTGMGNYRSPFCGFTNQRQAALGKNWHHFDDGMKLKQHYSSGFGAPASIQRGFAGGQQMPSSMAVIQSHHANPHGETNMSNMNQTLSIGADRQQSMCNAFQPQDMLADYQQTAGFAGKRARQMIAVPGQHSVGGNPQPTTLSDAFSSVMQPSRSFTGQQHVPWDEHGRRCQSYTETGAFTVLTVFCSKMDRLWTLALDSSRDVMEPAKICFHRI